MVSELKWKDKMDYGQQFWCNQSTAGEDQSFLKEWAAKIILKVLSYILFRNGLPYTSVDLIRFPWHKREINSALYFCNQLENASQKIVVQYIYFGKEDFSHQNTF